MLNLLEEVTEDGGVAMSVSQEPRSASASTVQEETKATYIFWKEKTHSSFGRSQYGLLGLDSNIYTIIQMFYLSHTNTFHSFLIL